MLDRPLLTERQPDNGVVVSIMANKKGGGGSTPGFQNVRMHEDADMKPPRYLVSESTATKLLGQSAADQLKKPCIVETSDGEKYTCHEEFGARWIRTRAQPQTQEITLLIAPGLQKDALFSKGHAANKNSSADYIATIEGPPQTPSMLSQHV